MHYFDVTDLFATCKTALEVMLRDVVLWEAQPWSVEAQSTERAQSVALGVEIWAYNRTERH